MRGNLEDISFWNELGPLTRFEYDCYIGSRNKEARNRPKPSPLAPKGLRVSMARGDRFSVPAMRARVALMMVAIFLLPTSVSAMTITFTTAELNSHAQEVRNPAFTVEVNDDAIYGGGWLGPVAVTIMRPDGSSETFSDIPVDETGFFMPNGGGPFYPFETGDLVTVTDSDGATKDLMLTPIEITAIDPDSDTLSGICTPAVNANVDIHQDEPSQDAAVSCNADGTFDATGTIDVRWGTNVNATQRDGDGDGVTWSAHTPPPPADLAVTKTDPPGRAPTGRDLTYTLTVVNNGPFDASEVTVLDQLPPSVTFISATPSQGTCGESSGTVTCNLGTIANGGTAMVEVVVKPTVPGIITNTATVGASTSDPYGGNNSDSEDTTVCRITSRRSSIPCP